MTESVFPEPLDDDDDDVAWALQTAKVQWNRGAQADALVWLGRAADSADQVGKIWRAADLRRMAVALSERLKRPPMPPAPLPRFEVGSDVDLEEVDDLEESGITAIPPPSRAQAPAPSFTSIPDVEVEEEPESYEPPPVRPRASDPIAQLLGPDDVELTEEVEILAEDELEDDELEDHELEDHELEDHELEDDVIEDDALSEPISTERSVEPASQNFADADDPVTRPLFEDPRLADLPRGSSLPPLPPLRSSRPPPSSGLPRATLAPLGANPKSDRAPVPVPVPVPVPPPAPEPEPEPRLGDVLLGEVRGLEDVPPEGQAILAHEAIIERLALNEEVASFGLALVLRGAVSIMPAIADLSCARAGKGEIVWSQGNLDEGIVLRLVAVEDATEVAVWSAELLKSTVRDYPWVVDDLKILADRFQALAGVAMGAMGERLDDALRASVTDRCEIKRLLPGELLTTNGKPVGGMYIVAAGRIEVVDGEAIESELGPGDFLFGPQVLSNGAAPHDSRAGHGGALVLFAPRAVAHDLLLSVPPLLEIFAT